MPELPPVELRASPVQLFAPTGGRILFGTLWVGGSLGVDGVRWSTFAIGVLWLVLGVLSGREALRSLDQVIMTIGPDGITGRDGRRIRVWDGVALVWVGYVPRFALFRRLQGPHVQVFTTAGVNFAQRADTDVKPSSSYVLPTSMPLADLCHTIDTFTTARVVDGDQVSRWKAARSLLPDRGY